ncbi:MAG: hypothetical protein ABSG31_03105 [Tepidisphaeraceae bacterium]|jgi:hypothetical protein
MLRNISGGLVCMAWGLWFGGLGALFLFATRLFAVDRPIALSAAPILFLVFERYQIVLAAAALMGALVWRILAKSVRVTVVFWLLAAASVPTALGPIFVTRRMEELRLAGQSSSPEFMKLHGISMLVYSGETLILLAAGLMLPWAMRFPPSPGTPGEGRGGGPTSISEGERQNENPP